MRAFKIFLIIGFYSIVICSNGQTVEDVIIKGATLLNTTITAPTNDATTLTADYKFIDPQNDKEGVSTFQWYRGDANNITDKASLTLIPSATSSTYTVQSADENKYLYYEVTPVDVESNSGTAGLSSASTQVTTSAYPNFEIQNGDSLKPAAGINYWEVSGTNSSLGIHIESGIVTINGDLDVPNVSGFKIIVDAGTTLIINGKLITKNHLDIIVNGTLEIYEGLDAKIGSDLDISGNMSIEGDINVEGNATFTVEEGATFDVGGDVNFATTGTNTLTVNGNMNVGGDLTGTATVSGDGDLSVTGIVEGTISDPGDVITPIELTYFKAYHNNNNVTIVWQTASEENNDYFTLERSLDGLNYQVIATIAGAGNSMTTLNYSYTDNNPVQGISYYRLTQTDYDGKFEVFSPVSVSYINEGELKIGPNPIQSHLNINTIGEVGTSVAKIYSLNGMLIKQKIMDSNFTTINTSAMPAGAYMLIITAGESSISRKIFVE